MTKSRVSVRLPKDALTRINLGQSFAEYDQILNRPGIFVETPALRAALDPARSKCFFVGRRGTGKTAIARYLCDRFPRTTLEILPELFSTLTPLIEVEKAKDPRRQYFRSLSSSFKRALQDEVLRAWSELHLAPKHESNTALGREKRHCEEPDFDIRSMAFIEQMIGHLERNDQKAWARQAKIPAELTKQMEQLQSGPACQFTILIDRVDESWDGSDEAVILLMALMHACVELCATDICVRPLIFLRENIFERVRELDFEFARLETCVVSMDWTQELLLEMIERRLNLPYVAKLPLGGATWDYFFEGIEGQSSREYVFSFCQERPRDVLTFCAAAIEIAQSHKKERVSIEDMQVARRQFSESRLKDLGDEYAENYPQLQVVLSRFYGLAREFTLNGLKDLIQKLISDRDVFQHCRWIYDYSSEDKFIRLMYDIGFLGIREGESVSFRSLGSRAPTLPPIMRLTNVVVHPSYSDALNLQNLVVGELDEDAILRTSGVLDDLPDAINLAEYRNELIALDASLKNLPTGNEAASEFEDLVGRLIKLCFYRALTNVEKHVRDVDGSVIRDWVASNRAASGFWQTVRQRYQALQVIWECKNYKELDAAAFHQCAYYMNEQIGYFVVLCFRGSETKKSYFEHIKNISMGKQGGIVLILKQSDLHVFIRQAINGKTKEDHIQGIYDNTIRRIS
jgi:hypothetical protein